MTTFDSIGDTELRRVGDELGASLNQIRYALTRALRRTQATLRKNAVTGLNKELHLRAMNSLRGRVKSVRMKSTVRLRSSGSNPPGEVALWIGLNDLPVSSFKGRSKQDVKGSWHNDYYFDGAFVAKSKVKNRNTIFSRKGADRLPIEEQSISIYEDSMMYIEEELFEQVEVLFWQHFKRDLQARIRFQLGGL
jgi:hypothetical protein